MDSFFWQIDMGRSNDYNFIMLGSGINELVVGAVISIHYYYTRIIVVLANDFSRCSTGGAQVARVYAPWRAISVDNNKLII